MGKVAEKGLLPSVAEAVAIGVDDGKRVGTGKLVGVDGAGGERAIPDADLIIGGAGDVVTGPHGTTQVVVYIVQVGQGVDRIKGALGHDGGGGIGRGDVPRHPGAGGERAVGVSGGRKGENNVMLGT